VIPKRGILLLLLLCSPALAADEEALPSGVESTVTRGLGFLAGFQEADGAFDGGAASSKVSTTSRALLAFLGAGNAPNTGRHGLVVEKALDWLVSQQSSDGYFGQTPQRGMRSHAMATLALAEGYGVQTDPDRRRRIRAALEGSVAVVVAAQAVAKSSPVFVGGWNASRMSTDSTLPVTVAQLLSLRACQDLGLPVPAQSLQSAGEFVLRCQDTQSGGFGPAPARAAEASSTAAGILSLHLLGLDSQRATQIDAAVKYLNARPIDANAPIGYASLNIVTLCIYEIGGGAWSGAGRAMVVRLTQAQEKDGGWPQPTAGAGSAPRLNRVGATAAALQTLTIPYQLLPIYQR
jgi:hypothetical protein